MEVDKSGADAVNAFEIYYTWFKIQAIQAHKSIRGQLENSIWFDSKLLLSKSRCQLFVAIDWTKLTCQRTT